MTTQFAPLRYVTLKQQQTPLDVSTPTLQFCLKTFASSEDVIQPLDHSQLSTPLHVHNVPIDVLLTIVIQLLMAVMVVADSSTKPLFQPLQAKLTQMHLESQSLSKVVKEEIMVALAMDATQQLEHVSPTPLLVLVKITPIVMTTTVVPLMFV